MCVWSVCVRVRVCVRVSVSIYILYARAYMIFNISMKEHLRSHRDSRHQHKHKKKKLVSLCRRGRFCYSAKACTSVFHWPFALVRRSYQHDIISHDILGEGRVQTTASSRAGAVRPTHCEPPGRLSFSLHVFPSHSYLAHARSLL